MAKQTTKYVFVTGGVLSGIGKGITAASIGNILKARGVSVNIQKCDPYLNVDAGTLSPGRHGETFVTKDGAETDLDLGHYERFIDTELTSGSSLMNGKILLRVIQDERAGKYLGRDVQVIPHVTTAMQDEIEKVGEGFDVHIVEIGGTMGDIESTAFTEAIRAFASRVGRENCLYVHVVYLPYLNTSQEFKTKPAQNAVHLLRGFGISPDVLVARAETEVPEDAIQKLSSFTVEREAIAVLPNARTVYEVPLTLEDSGIGEYISKKLKLKTKKPNLNSWRKVVERALDTPKKTLKIAIVAKYLDNQDTYMSVTEALRAAGWQHGAKTEFVWVDAEKLETEAPSKFLSKVDGIVVPGGFGNRGVNGKVKAAQYAIQKKIPYLGLCLGMQVGVIAFARLNGYPKAHSLESDVETPDPVIYIMDGQDKLEGTGGTMRLGDYKCVLTPRTKSAVLYGKKTILERHRHRYEFNNDYREALERAGLVIAGQSPNGKLVELIELKNHPFFVASQYHPEFKSRPNRPHPLFSGFIEAVSKRK